MVQRFWITSVLNHSFPPWLSTFSLAGFSFLECEPWRTRELVFNLARLLLLSVNQFLSSRASLIRRSIISAPISLGCDLKLCLGFSTLTISFYLIVYVQEASGFLLIYSVKRGCDQPPVKSLLPLGKAHKAHVRLGRVTHEWQGSQIHLHHNIKNQGRDITWLIF